MQSRPVLIYGTLSAVSLLALVLTRDRTRTNEVLPLVHRIKVPGYRLCSVRGKTYPAFIQDASSWFNGILLWPLTASQRQIINKYEERGSYRRVETTVALQDVHGNFAYLAVDIYIWDGEALELDPTSPWSIDTWTHKHLDKMLDWYDAEKVQRNDLNDD